MFQAFLDWRYSYFLNEPTFASVFKAFPQIHFQENHIPYFQNWLSVKMWRWSLCVALSRGCPALWSSCVLVCLWVVCSMRFHGCTQGRRLSSSMWVGLFQSAEGLNKTKRWTFPPVTSSSSCLSAWSRHWSPPASRLKSDFSLLGSQHTGFQRVHAGNMHTWLRLSHTVSSLPGLQPNNWRLKKQAKWRPDVKLPEQISLGSLLAKRNLDYYAKQAKLNLVQLEWQ